MSVRPQRDMFLDLLRALALFRVILWHAFGTPAISWVYTTMPVMFFIAGSLLYGSLERGDTIPVLRRRLKRLLVPFWFFGAVVLTTIGILHITNPSASTAMGLDQLLTWFFPLVNPSGPEWEAGWASSPLWYLRAYLWLLLLSPLLKAAWDRVGSWSLIPSVFIVIIAQVVADATAAGQGALIFVFGDIGLYGFFVLLGFAQATGALDSLKRRDLFEWLVVGVVGTVVLWRMFPSADGVINHSYPALLAYGLTWITLALIARAPLQQFTTQPMVAKTLTVINRRAMSIYLWHSPAIVAVYWLFAQFGRPGHPIVLTAFVLILVAVASVATGWIEDVAAGKPAEFRVWRNGPVPERTTKPFVAPRFGGALLASAAGALVLAAMLVPVPGAGVDAQPADALASADDDSSLKLPPAPSGRPDANATAGGNTDVQESGSAESDAAESDAAESDGGGLGLPPAPSGRPDPTAGSSDSSSAADASTIVNDGDLDTLLESWRTGAGIDGVQVGVILADGSRVYATAGSNSDGSALELTEPVPVTSITKTMTAAIALQLVEEGLLTLDGSATDIGGVLGHSRSGDLTLRMLLDHSSGVTPYQSAPGYDGGSALTALQAVAMSGQAPLEWEPGTVGGYSNSGFLTVGLLIEQITGSPYDVVLAERVFGPLGLSDTYVDAEPTAGWVGHSAGGVVSTLPDLLTWGNALYQDRTVISGSSLGQMVSVDPNLMSGLGAFPVCPCQPASDGSVAYTSIGHNGGSITMQYAPSSDILIVASFSESFWISDFDQNDVYQLLEQVRVNVGS